MRKYLLIFFFFINWSSLLFSQVQDSLQIELLNLDDKDKPAVLNQLWKQHRDTDLGKATAYAHQALSLSLEYKLESQIALSYKNIGLSHWFKNELDSALIRYQKALTWYSLVNNQEEIARVYNNIGVVLTRQEKRDSAISILQKALEINLQREDSARILGTYINLSVVYYDIQNYATTLAYETKALSYASNKKDRIYANIGVTISKLYGSDSALFYYKKALYLTKDNRLKQSLYLNIGSNYLHLNQVDSAKKFLKKGKALIKDLNSKEYVKALMDEGMLALYEGNYLKSLEYSKESILIAETQKYTMIQYSLRDQLSKIYAAMNQWEKAYNWFQLANQLNDSLNNIENSKHLADLQAKFEFEKNELKIEKLAKKNLEQEVQIALDKNFKIILASSILIIIVLFLFFFQRYKRKQAEKQHKLEKKRIEIEQKLLRSQMNPHFIFNALNSIQSFISSNDAYSAEVFLSKFAVLIRNILEYSSQQFVDFDKEIETLKLYLELEKMRFNNKFDYHFNTESIDYDIEIPPMLIQPFIENAILHGMKDKKGKGIINIDFIQGENNTLQCEIIDNGVGREKAKQLDKRETHKSLGMELTSERMEFFNTKSSSLFKVVILDLKNKNQQAIGTKVSLIIPCNAL